MNEACSYKLLAHSYQNGYAYFKNKWMNEEKSKNSYKKGKKR